VTFWSWRTRITAPNKFVANVHDRMPAILESKDFERWEHGNAKDAAALVARGLLGGAHAEIEGDALWRAAFRVHGASSCWEHSSAPCDRDACSSGGRVGHDLVEPTAPIAPAAHRHLPLGIHIS
jgi:hypothetical protein